MREVGRTPPAVVSELLVLQYLRGIAAMAVAIYHVQLGVAYFSGSAAQATSGFGAAGVDLFFVISGFIMFYITSEKEPSPRQFLKARLLRVLPLYWLITLAMFFMPLVSPTIGWSSHLLPGHLLTSLFVIGGVSWPGLGEFPVYRAGWTINYEIFFYLIFGACLVLRPVARGAAVACAILTALVAIGWMVGPRSGIASFYTKPILLEFVFGVGVAWLYMRRLLLPQWLAWIVLPVGVAGLYLLAGSPADSFMQGLPSSLIVMACLSLEQAARRRPVRLLKVLGDASYSIYLTHLFILPAVDIAFRELSLNMTPTVTIVYFVVGILGSALAGVACYQLVERPLHGWARKVSQRHKATAPSEPAHSAVGPT